MNTIDYILPTHWLCALINADESGMDDSDIEALNRFIARESKGHKCFHALCPDEKDDLGFCHDNDGDRYAQDCTRITFDIGE